MILQSLPESFKEFKLNYNMNKKIYTLSELMNELVAAEGILGTSNVEANIGEASTSQPKSKDKGKKKKKKKKKKKDFTKQVGKQIVLGVADKGKKLKGKCFHCGEKGHWKRNCPIFKATKNKGMKNTFLLEICLVQNPTDSQCVDLSCTNRICNSLQGFQETRKLKERELFLTLVDGSRIPVVVVGVFNLCFESRVLVLEDCLYVPNVRRNLISATYLGKHGYCVILKDNVVRKKSIVFICSGNIVDGLYILTPDKHELYNFELDNNSYVKSLKRKFPSTSDAYLQPLRLDHINSNRIQRLIKDGLLEPMDFDEFPVCESCLEGKMTKRPFNTKGRRAQDLLELVHSDVYGPMSTKAKGGYQYFLTFTDDYSRYGYVYLMRQKSEAFEKFKEFKAEVENQLGKRIKAIRSNNSGEYLLGDFKDHLTQNRIVSQLAAPRTPQQNGVAERRNMTLLKMVRSMISYLTLPVSFWGYALKTAMHILNLVPSKSVPNTPKEL